MHIFLTLSCMWTIIQPCARFHLFNLDCDMIGYWYMVVRHLIMKSEIGIPCHSIPWWNRSSQIYFNEDVRAQWCSCCKKKKINKTDVERRETIDRLRSINPSIITHFTSQIPLRFLVMSRHFSLLQFSFYVLVVCIWSDTDFVFVSSLMSTGKFDVICCTRARASMKSDPEAVRPQNVTRCSRKLECSVATNPDWSVLSTIITWHFQLHLVNLCNLHFLCTNMALKVTTVSRATLIVTSHVIPQFPTSRDAALLTRDLTSVMLACLNPLKRALPQQNIFTMNLRIYLNIVMLFSHQKLLEFPINGDNVWAWEYGDTRLPSLQTRLLDVGHM